MDDLVPALPGVVVKGRFVGREPGAPRPAAS
jgi:hypothetical protein